MDPNRKNNDGSKDNKTPPPPEFPTFAIVLIVLVGVLIILVIIAIVYLVRRRKRRVKSGENKGKVKGGGAKAKPKRETRSDHPPKVVVHEPDFKDVTSKYSRQTKTTTKTTTKAATTTRPTMTSGKPGGLGVPTRPGDDGYIDMTQGDAATTPMGTAPGHPPPRSPAGGKRPLPSIKEPKEKAFYDNKSVANVYDELQEPSYYEKPVEKDMNDAGYQGLERNNEYTPLESYLELTPPNYN